MHVTTQHIVCQSFGMLGIIERCCVWSCADLFDDWFGNGSGESFEMSDGNSGSLTFPRSYFKKARRYLLFGLLVGGSARIRKYNTSKAWVPITWGNRPLALSASINASFSR